VRSTRVKRPKRSLPPPTSLRLNLEALKLLEAKWDFVLLPRRCESNAMFPRLDAPVSATGARLRATAQHLGQRAFRRLCLPDQLLKQGSHHHFWPGAIGFATASRSDLTSFAEAPRETAFAITVSAAALFSISIRSFAIFKQARGSSGKRSTAQFHRKVDRF
jgi:hypothetical protein